MGYQIKSYKADDGWRWRMVAENNRIVADGAQSYASQRNVNRAIETLKENMGLALVNREQFIVLRRNHWDKAVDKLLDMFSSRRKNKSKIDDFLATVADASV